VYSTVDTVVWWRHRWTVGASLYKTRSETSNQCKSACSSWESPAW